MVVTAHRIPIKMEGAIWPMLNRSRSDLLAIGSSRNDDRGPPGFGSRRAADVQSEQSGRNQQIDCFFHVIPFLVNSEQNQFGSSPHRETSFPRSLERLIFVVHRLYSSYRFEIVAEMKKESE